MLRLLFVLGLAAIFLGLAATVVFSVYHATRVAITRGAEMLTGGYRRRRRRWRDDDDVDDEWDDEDDDEDWDDDWDDERRSRRLRRRRSERAMAIVTERKKFRHGRRYGRRHDAGERSGDKTPPLATPALPSAWPTRLIGLAALPLAFAPLTSDDAASLVIGLAALLAILGGAWMIREGQKAQAAYDARRIARPPVLPRKLLGHVAIGTGLALALFSDGAEPAPALAYGAVGALLSAIAFGFDPMRAKGLAPTGDAATDRAARSVAEAEAIIDEIVEAVAPLGDSDLAAEVALFADTARQMCHAILDDPRDLNRARRYLGVYLEGAREATKRYVRLASSAQGRVARRNYLSLLSDLRAAYAQRKQELLVNDRDALDIEIEVLRERLKRDMGPS